VNRYDSIQAGYLKGENTMQIIMNPVQQLRGEMDRLLSGFFGPTFDGLWPGEVRNQPAVNTWDQGGELLAEMELPGVKSEQIEVSVTGDELTVRVERPDVTENDVTYHRRERPAGSFTRILSLPCAVDAQRVEADLRNGVLTLRLPKAESAKPRKITVTSA
jgi:HSP20 family protein